MNSTDALAGPGLLALLIAIPISGMLAARGRRGMVLALALLAILVAANLWIADNVSEYGDLGLVFILALASFSLPSIWIGWYVGGHLRAKARAQASVDVRVNVSQ